MQDNFFMKELKQKSRYVVSSAQECKNMLTQSKQNQTKMPIAADAFFSSMGLKRNFTKHK
jgi:hypothetical protein